MTAIVTHGLTVGLDLDNTTLDFDTPCLDRLVSTSGRPRDSFGPPSDYSLSKRGWFTSQEEFLVFHGDAIRDGFLRDQIAYPGASESLWRLSDAGFHIRVITHRLIVPGEHARIAADTVACLDANRIPYRDICFSADKASIACDVYIEDAPYQIEPLRAAGHRVIVRDQTYNRHLPGPRGRDWSEIETLLFELRELLAAGKDWS